MVAEIKKFMTKYTKLHFRGEKRPIDVVLPKEEYLKTWCLVTQGQGIAEVEEALEEALEGTQPPGTQPPVEEVADDSSDDEDGDDADGDDGDDGDGDDGSDSSTEY